MALRRDCFEATPPSEGGGSFNKTVIISRKAQGLGSRLRSPPPPRPGGVSTVENSIKNFHRKQIRTYTGGGTRIESGSKSRISRDRAPIGK
ncbi:hypothetical protein EVAR_23585_1 [Eumeta japonica]|uniref:Uncharacterized protein n=1 Tax=Eumeta variegata TaxID=151549 RepID=A0A4C1WX81_EUMVA|nr:hypothetical protein EVAR_23585_1 [Eumeta japonica]